MKFTNKCKFVIEIRVTASTYSMTLKYSFNDKTLAEGLNSELLNLGYQNAYRLNEAGEVDKVTAKKFTIQNFKDEDISVLTETLAKYTKS